jgi:hypothetical protein
MGTRVKVDDRGVVLTLRIFEGAIIVCLIVRFFHKRGILVDFRDREANTEVG